MEASSTFIGQAKETVSERKKLFFSFLDTSQIQLCLR